jgi:thioredoxin 2
MKPDQVQEARTKHKKERAEQAAKAEAAKKAAAAEGVIALTRQNFEREVLRSQVPVVIDCWADWCNPCKQFSPVFEATAKQYVGIVKFAKLDTEAEPALAAGLGVQALPTILMFYKGQLVNMVEGALPASSFQQWIYQTLAAIRQYEQQLSAEAEDAITAASKNLAALGATQGGEGETAADTLATDSATPSSTPQTNGRRVERGKQTSSGLYIP